jgi:signal transduction histidine kinase
MVTSKRTPAPAPEPAATGNLPRTLDGWRERILHVTLVATAVLAAIAYVPGVLAAIGDGLWLVVVVDTVAWALVVVLAVFRHRIPYRVRAAAFLAVVYLLGLLLLLEVGPVGGGVIWLAAFPVFASAFSGLRVAVGALLLTVVTLLLLGGALALHGDLLAEAGMAITGYELRSWVGMSGGLVFIASVLSLSIASLLRGLGAALEEANRSREELVRVNRELAEEIQERQRIQEQLLQSQKMEALGTLAGGIAHDFNNLLVPIVMESREVRDTLPESSPEREAMDGVLRSALRARDLVQRILAFSRGSGAERRPLEVDPLVREVGSLVRSLVPAHIRVECRLQASQARVHAAESELHQVVMNLATNAFLAMKGEGAQPPPPEPPGGHRLILTTGLLPDEGAVSIRVEDTGRGMSPQVAERAFDPFYTTRPPGEGTGLGLATVHGIVSQLKGTVHLDTGEARGTRVEVRLPLVYADAPGPDRPEAEPERRGSGNYRMPASLLVVDDEPLVLRSTRMLLTRLGYVVSEASSPESALRQVQEAPMGFDLVITDQAMPGMTGLELARRLRTIRPDLPIILASGYLDDDALQAAEALALQGILQKPYDRESLNEVLSTALDRPPPR